MINKMMQQEHNPAKLNQTYNSQVFQSKEGERDPLFDHTILAQRKAPAQFTPNHQL